MLSPLFAGLNLDAPEGALLPQATVQGMAPIDTGQRDADRQTLLNLLSQVPQMQQPQPVHPAFRTPDAIAGGLSLLLSLFGGKQGGQIGGAIANGWSQGKMQKAQQDTQQNQLNANFANQQALSQNNADLNVAKTKLNFSESDVQDQEKERIRQEQQAFKDELQKDKLVGGFQTAYSNAKSEAEMKRIAKNWATFEMNKGLPVTAPDETSVAEAWHQKSGIEIDRIKDNWARTLAREVKDQYGRVAPTRIADLQALKASEEGRLKLYGEIHPMLDPIPTEETAVGRHKEGLYQLAQDKGVILKDKADQDLIESRARILRAQERIALDQQRLGVSQFNANTARMNHELRQQGKQVDKQIENRINALKAQIQGKESLLKTEESPAKKKSIMADIVEMKGRVQYWRGQMDPQLGLTSEPSIGTSQFTTPQGNKYTFGGS